MVMVEASCVMVASCPSPPMPPPGAFRSGISVHFPAKLGGACAAAIVVAAMNAASVSTRLIPELLVDMALTLSARSLRPGRSCALRHVKRREDADRLHAFDQPFALSFELLQFVAEVCYVFLVDHHLAPVLDEEIARL